jgi:plasmid stability protein
VTGAADGFTLSYMSMMIEVPDETARRLALAAARRGISAEALAVELLDAVDAVDAEKVDDEFLVLVDEVIADHRTILDRLAT